ncbi:YsnF/AvaK domain-containing protein [Psychrobacter glacincola]|uniref:YsnF/AvaK domain-containing protein n=1 Tax=Psychrobacter glacincola TaxID=56810 RepID=UPI0039B0F075
MNANNENNYPDNSYPEFTNNDANGTPDNLTSSDLSSYEHSQKQAVLDDQKIIPSENILGTNNKVGYLELLEERPVVNKERLDVGKVTVTKHFRTKTIQVPIELVEEYITVRTDHHDSESQDLLSGNYDDKDILRHVEPSLDSKAVVTINGKQVEIGDTPIEIILSRQVATITKDTYVIQEVAIEKTTHTHTDSIEVELKHEELDVNEEGYLAHQQNPTQKR